MRKVSFKILQGCAHCQTYSFSFFEGVNSRVLLWHRGQGVASEDPCALFLP